MTILAFVLIAFTVPMVSCKSISGQYYETPSDTKTCANDLIAWCDGMKFPTQGGSISMVSVSIIDSNGYSQATCTADPDGTNCTKNGSPWLSCSNKNQLLYKGSALAKDSLDGTDNGTCETADKAFNDLFVQNLSSDNTTMQTEMETGLEQAFRAIQSIEEKIAEMQRRITTMFSGGFPFYNNNPYIPSGLNFYNNNPYVRYPSDDGVNASPMEEDREIE